MICCFLKSTFVHLCKSCPPRTVSNDAPLLGRRVLEICGFLKSMTSEYETLTKNNIILSPCIARVTGSCIFIHLHGNFTVPTLAYCIRDTFNLIYPEEYSYCGNVQVCIVKVPTTCSRFWIHANLMQIPPRQLRCTAAGFRHDSGSVPELVLARLLPFQGRGRLLRLS